MRIMRKNTSQPEEIPTSKEDEIFKLLTHQTRRNIIKILGEHDLAFSQIRRDLEIDSPTLSYHLKSMKEFVKQKKSKYYLSEIGRAALILLTKTDQSMRMSKYKRYFWYLYAVSYLCWIATGSIIPIVILYSNSLHFSIIILEIAINVIGTINMTVIGILKSRYT